MELVNPERPILSKRLILQPLLPLHAAALFADLQAPDLYKFIPHDPPESEEKLKEKYRRWATRRSADGSELWLNFALYRPDHADYVGTIQATLELSGKTYIAYEVFPRFWRQGFAREAGATIIAYLRDSHKVSTISALVDTRNEASWKLLESLGFRRVEILKNADEFKGAISDEYLYEL
jgi:[ribosomal protein S5]-alanine N-acetyltransferase